MTCNLPSKSICIGCCWNCYQKGSTHTFEWLDYKFIIKLEIMLLLLGNGFSFSWLEFFCANKKPNISLAKPYFEEIFISFIVNLILDFITFFCVVIQKIWDFASSYNGFIDKTVGTPLSKSSSRELMNMQIFACKCYAAARRGVDFNEIEKVTI